MGIAWSRSRYSCVRNQAPYAFLVNIIVKNKGYNHVFLKYSMVKVEDDGKIVVYM